jgi:hypothetical protein
MINVGVIVVDKRMLGVCETKNGLGGPGRS